MSNIQTGAERMPHDLSHLGFLAGQIGRLITISTTPRSEERFSRNAETDLVCRLLLEKKKSDGGSMADFPLRHDHAAEQRVCTLCFCRFKSWIREHSGCSSVLCR